MPGYTTFNLKDREGRHDPAGIDWLPLRADLGIRAFGMNAWRATQAGAEVIERHTEDDHQEVYVVVAGRARFTVGGDEIDAPAGTLIYVEEPPLERVGIAEEPGTIVLAVGAEPGRAFSPSDWEERALANS